MNKPENTLTIATYNIEFSKHADVLIKNIAYLQEKGVSVLCLQEVMQYENIPFIIDQLLKTLGKDWKAKYFIGRKEISTDHGVAILWDEQILKLQKIETLFLPRLLKLNLLERCLAFFFRRTHAATQIDRKAIIGTFLYKKNLIRITSLHLDLAGGVQQRNRQATFFLDHLMKNTNVKKEIVCGDFNTIIRTPRRNEKVIMQKVFMQYGFADATHQIEWSHDAMSATFRDDFAYISKIIKTLHLSLKQKLDYIWTKNVEVVEASKIDLLGSDHRPLIATFKIDQ